MSAFLSADELRELTGRARKADQVAWLRARHNIRFWVNALGRPVVPRGQFGESAAVDPPRVRPNLAAIGKGFIYMTTYR